MLSASFSDNMADYSSSRVLSEKLQQEKEKSYDLGVEVRELKNKISLIRDGVPVTTFDTIGIDVLHQIKLIKNCHTIAEQVRFIDVCNHLIADNILESRDVETIESEKSDYARMSKLLHKYMSGPKAYPSLRRALRIRYDHIFEGLDNTEVKKEEFGVEKMEVNGGNVESMEELRKLVKAASEKITDLQETIKQQDKAASEKITDLQETIKQQDRKLEASEKDMRDLNKKLKRQSTIIEDQSTIIQSHDDAIAKFQDDTSDQNKKQKDNINELERRMKESVECLEKQVRDDVTNRAVVETLKQSQREVIAQMKIGMEEDAASVLDKMTRMRTELKEISHRQRERNQAASPSLRYEVGLANSVITLDFIV